MLGALHEAEEADDGLAELEGEKLDAESIRERMMNDFVLSLELRNGWYTPGQAEVEPTEFRILLCTGGPAVMIVGDLDEHSEPDSARLQYQDWGTPWTNYPLSDTTSEEDAALLRYCHTFYFGE